MKAHKNNILTRFLDYMTKKYKAPEECKLVMADRNLNTMFKAQVMLIIMGFYGVFRFLSQEKVIIILPSRVSFILAYILSLVF